jgi:ribosomal protein L24E
VSFNREPIEIRMSANLTHASTGGFLCPTRFVLVNDRVPRRDADCALCGSKIEKGYVRESQTHLFYCDTQCFAGHANAIKNHARKVSWNAQILIAIAASASSLTGAAGSASGTIVQGNCRDAFVTDLPKRSQQVGRVTTYFEWLFLQPIGNPQQKLKPAVIGIKAR